MKYYSTNHQAPLATLREAVVKGLAGDRGLYMPETIKTLPKEFFDNIDSLSFQEIACTVADAFQLVEQHLTDFAWFDFI